MKSLSALVALLCAILLLAGSCNGLSYDEVKPKNSNLTPLTVDDARYNSLISAKRDFGIVLTMTALSSQYKCQLCREFRPEWDVVAKTWFNHFDKASSKSSFPLLFGTADIDVARNAFERLQLRTAPVVAYFPPTSGPFAKQTSNPAMLDFNQGPQTAEQVQTWLARQLPGVSVPAIKRPLNYGKVLIMGTIALGFISVSSIAWPVVLPVFQSRYTWATCSILAILVFTSGHMFNQIRKVPYVIPNNKGGITYFVGGFSNQLGLETQIVAALYGVLSFSTIALAIRVPRISNMKAQQASIFIWGSVMLIGYSFLISVFKIKNGGYPFRIPPF